MTSDIQQIPLTNTLHSVHLTRLPMIPAIFCRFLISAFTRPAGLPNFDRGTRARLYLADVFLDPERIHRYRRVCGFSHAPDDLFVPPGFIQTLFIGLLGRYITSDFFPINPMGLIQTGQQFESSRPVRIGERVNLSCTLQEMALAPKGVLTRFLLEADQGGQPVWQGISTYLTRTCGPKCPAGKKLMTRPCRPGK